MPIRFLCLQCQVRMRVPDGAAGLRIRCPKCGVSQHVPAVSMDDDPANATAMGMPVTEHVAEGGVAQAHAPAHAPADWPDDAGATQPDPGNDNPLAALAAIASGGQQPHDAPPAHIPGPATHEQQQTYNDQDPAEALRRALEQPAAANPPRPAPTPNQAMGAYAHATAQPPTRRPAAAPQQVAPAHQAQIRQSPPPQVPNTPRVPQFAPPPPVQHAPAAADNQHWDGGHEQGGSEVDALRAALEHDPVLSPAITPHIDSAHAPATPRAVQAPPRLAPAPAARLAPVQQQQTHQPTLEPAFHTPPQAPPLPPRAAPLPPPAAGPAVHRPVARPIPVGAQPGAAGQMMMSATQTAPMQATAIAIPIPHQVVPTTPPPPYKVMRYTSMALMGFSGLAAVVTVLTAILTTVRSSKTDPVTVLIQVLTGLSISAITMGIALALQALRDIAQNSYRK